VSAVDGGVQVLPSLRNYYEFHRGGVDMMCFSSAMTWPKEHTESSSDDGKMVKSKRSKQPVKAKAVKSSRKGRSPEDHENKEAIELEKLCKKREAQHEAKAETAVKPGSGSGSGSSGSGSGSGSAAKTKGLKPELVPQLRAALERAGSTGKDKLINEFLSAHPEAASKRQLTVEIDLLAVKEKREGDHTSTWHLLTTDSTVAVPLVASADKKKKEKPSSKRKTAGPCKKEKPTDDDSGTGAPNRAPQLSTRGGKPASGDSILYLFGDTYERGKITGHTKKVSRRHSSESLSSQCRVSVQRRLAERSLRRRRQNGGAVCGTGPHGRLGVRWRRRDRSAGCEEAKAVCLSQHDSWLALD
jgi:hypothetical protein